MALPKYEQIAAELRGRIVRGELSTGDALPSVPELSQTWAVARATAERAIGVLRHEGLVETQQGRGTYVRERVPLARTAGERYRTARETGFVYTAGEHADIVAAEELAAPEDVATALGIAVGDPVARGVEQRGVRDLALRGEGVQGLPGRLMVSERHGGAAVAGDDLGRGGHPLDQMAPHAAQVVGEERAAGDAHRERGRGA